MESKWDSNFQMVWGENLLREVSNLSNIFLTGPMTIIKWILSIFVVVW
jgi:hypothetical protein